MLKRLSAHRADTFCCVLLTAIYGTILFLGQRRTLWYDEIFTWSIARLPAASEVWDALRDGVDLNPPLSYLLVRLSQSVFGDGNFGTRLPFMVALCLTALLLYVFMARRASRVVAMGVALLPLASKSFLYGFEARPYALLMMCGAASLLFYSNATNQAATWSIRKANLIALALCLAIAVSSHYFGVFLLWPLVIGEIVRWWKTRHLERAVFVSMLGGIVPLLFFVPLLRDARQYASGFWAQPDFGRATSLFLSQFLEMFWSVAIINIAGLTLVFLSLRRKPSQVSSAESSDSRREWAAHEWASVIALALLPIVCVLAATLMQSGYVFRYAVAGVIGACLLLGLMAARVEKTLPATRWMFLTICVLCALLNQAGQGVWRHDNRVLETVAALQNAASQNAQLSIIVSEPQRFLQLHHYASPALRQRLFYLADTSLALRYTKEDTGDRALLKLARWSSISVRDYAAFTRSNAHFLLLDDSSGESWISQHLKTKSSDSVSRRNMPQAVLESNNLGLFDIQLNKQPTSSTQ